ncbi:MULTISPECIES: phospholipase D family protein [unclassified Caballeronia]|uniref:phospholipase D family nuclease n=1 Tax=unclassified Caballeronia TaxID=2646786 RepID=UPI002862DD3D|nr:MULTISPECIES: phospholipase D family protein [unclassified Caballeronia]MDR5776987.1 phospholipase D family protein [Caballeronia sp. LZ002]MDR5852438.1 phospholipase D family protein [Caballeronia sp. LZ003]
MTFGSVGRGFAGLAFLCALAFGGSARASEGVTVEVGFTPGGSAEALVLKTLNSARQSIRLIGYSFTSPEIVQALIDAKRRGVDVAVAVDYKSNFEEDRSGRGRAALGALVNAGIPTRVVSAFPITHSKFFVTDGRTVETGSFNYTRSAARRNAENVVVLSGNLDVVRAYLKNWAYVYSQGEDYHPH